ncbi:MAG TPA: ADP-ribosylglycohydrolase family protein [Mycobacteriales bacterium]|jgi:ADP-ribosylglycohydrolase
MTTLADRAAGCLSGAAVGDALGGPTEGWTTDQIRQRYGGFVEDIVPPYFADWRGARPNSPYHKGDGHVTDDTLMTQAFARAYLRKQDHLDAYDVESLLVPQMVDDSRWIPELETEAPLLRRVFLAEKWLVLRLAYGHVDPREAGTGNIVNCGAAMYIAPVGIVNAGDPDGAYAEAIDVTGAHQSSYGREAAGVLAAAVAAALDPDATVESVVATCLRVAKDGTRAAIEAVCDAAASITEWSAALGPLRDAIRPFDTVADDYREPGLAARRPSRLHAIEELPVALGMLLVARGDYVPTVLGGVNYGRDADSIASMGGALAGALGGLAAVPEKWRTEVAAASRLDIEGQGRQLARLAVDIFTRDDRRHRDRAARLSRLTADT